MYKIKHYIITAVSLLGMSTLTSCDIEPADRFQELPPVQIERTALLMDFTGQNCVNCPQAHEDMAELVKQYGESALITVSIHGGAMAMSVDRTNFDANRIGLMIKEGNEMNDAFGINQWPMGVVDRINAPGAAINTGLWATAVRDALSTPTDVQIEAKATLEGDDIKVATTIISDSDRNAALQIWVVENGIVAQQLTPNGREKDYVHNNVLRFVKYGKEGEPLALTKGVSSNVETEIKCKWNDTERWDKNKLSIVAFVFEGTYILNATRVEILPAEE